MSKSVFDKIYRGMQEARAYMEGDREGYKVTEPVRHSLSQIKATRERGEDQTSPDAPEAESLGADFWSSARVVMLAKKKLREDLKTSTLSS